MSKKLSIIQIVKKVCPGVITIVTTKDLSKIEGFYYLPFGEHENIIPEIEEKTKKEKTKIGSGSGFIISKDGFVLTCNHVVENLTADYTVILNPQKKYPAKIIERDPLIDLAILKIEGEDLPFLKLGNSNKIELGEQVIAVGNPLGEFEDTISAGIISGLSRKITAYGGLPLKTTSLRGLIQTDAAINPGNSGGPLINMEGKVIGINTAMVMGAQNLGFAIPIDYAKKDLEEVKKNGKILRPFLGIKYFTLNAEIAKANKLPVDYGVLIIRELLGEEAIVKDSPAERAKLKEYDIILEINGEKITEDNTLIDILQKHKIKEKIHLKVLRQKNIINVELVLEQKK